MLMIGFVDWLSLKSREEGCLYIYTLLHVHKKKKKKERPKALKYKQCMEKVK